MSRVPFTGKPGVFPPGEVVTDGVIVGVGDGVLVRVGVLVGVMLTVGVIAGVLVIVGVTVGVGTGSTVSDLVIEKIADPVLE